MADSDMVDQELKAYLEIEENLTRQDKYLHLKAIFDKHFSLEKTSHLLTMNDFYLIISNAKQHYTQMVLPATISNREVYLGDAPHISMIEAVISHLNRFDVLKRLVKIDITTKTNK